MFESHPELDGLESVPDTQEVPSPALAFIGATCTVAVIVFITLSLFI